MLKFVKSLKSENVETLVFKPSDDDVLLPVEDDSLRGKWVILNSFVNYFSKKLNYFSNLLSFQTYFYETLGECG